MLNDSSKPDAHSDLPAKGPAVSWGPVSAILFTILIFIGAQIIGVILLMLLGGWNKGELELSSIGGQFAFVVMSDALIMTGLWLFLRRWQGSFRHLGFARRPAWKDIGLAFLAYIAYFGLLLVAVGLVNAFTNVDLNQKQELGFENIIKSTEILMALISLVILPPIVEEIVFRGFLYSGLRKKLPFILAALATSLLFAAPHLLASSKGLLWIAGVDTFILSLVLCYLREKTGALWSPMIVHMIKNSVAFALLLTGFAFL